MSRLYTMGIIMIVLFLNVPEVRGDTENRIRFYRPLVEQQINSWSDKYTPALTTLVQTLKNNKQTIINGELINTTTNIPIDTTDSWSLDHKPSITSDQFDSILRAYSSPASGVGSYVTRYATDKHIDTAYILYMFIHESTAGTNPAWAGIKTDGTYTHNPGNVICVDEYPCYGRFADLPDWNTGFELMIDLLVEYRDGAKQFYGGSKRHTTIDEAIATWAPSSENDTDGYINSLHEHVSKWRAANANVEQIRKPVQSTGRKHVVTDRMEISASFDTVDCTYWSFQSGCQHYGTDILVDADMPVYAPVDCYYLTTGHYDDPSHAGDYFMCETDGYELYLGHLKDALRYNQPGEYIAAGTIIGYGCICVSGPHTHVQLRNPHGTLTDFMTFYNERD